MSRYISKIKEKNQLVAVGFDINGGYFFDLENTANTKPYPDMIEETNFMHPLTKIEFLKLCLKYGVTPPEIDTENFKLQKRFDYKTGKIL